MKNQRQRLKNRVLTLISKIQEIQEIAAEQGEQGLPCTLESVKQELMSFYMAAD